MLPEIQYSSPQHCVLNISVTVKNSLGVPLTNFCCSGP